MNKAIKLLLIFFLIASCSFHKNSKFWNKENLKTEKLVKLEKLEKNKKVFKKKKKINSEFNSNLIINLPSNFDKNSTVNNSNNDGKVDYEGKLQTKSKYKFSKIKKFYEYEPQIITSEKGVIFFDNKGAILNFSKNSNLLWKKNYYSKNEQNKNPILFFASNKDFLIVADTIAKLYVIDINTGKLIWSKKNSAPFNSQIKIYNDKFFVIDFDNNLKGYLIKNGEKILDVKTENTLIRSQKKLSIVIVNENIYFNNSLGDISSVNIKSGELLWQTPTQNYLVYNDSLFLKTSEIITDNKNLYFSNNKNEFFSLDLNTGTLNWKQDINSNLRSTIVGDYLFTVTMNGHLVVIDKNKGNIIRINNIFSGIKKNKNIKPTGFIIGNNSIFITTSHGRLLDVDTKSGKIKSIIKIDNNKINRPSIFNQDMFITTENSIIKLN